MLKLLWVVLPVLVLVMLAAAATGARRPRKATGQLGARRPLTPREQSMYFRLIETFPGHIVLAQVAFSAILTTKDRPTRATFDRKVCDFVLCSKAFEVIAVIELDDASHRVRERADAKRQALLTGAGYRVERFAQIPDQHDLRDRLLPAVPTQTTLPTTSATSAAIPEPSVPAPRRLPSSLKGVASTSPRQAARAADTQRDLAEGSGQPLNTAAPPPPSRGAASLP